MPRLSGTAAFLLSLLLAAPAWPEPIRITGRIEPPVSSGARIELRSYPAPQGEALATARPAADGSFVLTAPDSGFYRVIVRADGVPDLEHPLMPLVEETELPAVRLERVPAPGKETGRRALEWRPAETRPLARSSAAIQTGRVVDALTRKPVAHALVWQEIPGASFSWARTGADGSFRMAAEAGRPVAAKAAGFARGVWSEIPQESPATLFLKPAVVLTGSVVDLEGRPVAGAEVMALNDPLLDPFAFRDPTVDRTRRDGTFRLRGVPVQSSVRVLARAEGYAPGATRTRIEPGQAPPTLRLVLGPGAVVTGRLVTPEGGPAAGVGVVLEAPELSENAELDSAPVEGRATSDAEGRFQITHIGTGTFILRAADPGFSRAGKIFGVAEKATMVDLGEIRLEPGAALEGEVLDEQGAPVQGARVMLQPPRPYSREDLRILASMLDRRAPILTGAEGSFRFPRLPAGSRFDLIVFHRDHPLTYVPGVEIPRQEPLRITLQPGRILSGRVVDDRGRPVPDISLSWDLGEIAFAQAPMSRLHARTDAEGGFELRMLKPGPLALTVNATGFLPKEVRLRIPEEGEHPAVEIALDRGAAVAGRVLDEQGVPVAGATVRILAGPFESRFRSFESVTDREGRYRIEALTKGRHRITARAADGQTAERGIEIGDGDIPAFDLTLTSGFEVSGRITDVQGAPVAGAQVSLHSSDLGMILGLQTGDDGSFRRSDVPEGRYHLTCRAEGFADTALPQDVEVVGGPVTGLELQMEAGGAISGRILGLEEHELPRIEVTAFGGDRPARLPLQSRGAPEGLYRITGVPLGAWRVIARLTPDRLAEGTVRVSAPGEEAVLDLRFGEGVAVSGRVRLDGEPLSGARVALGVTDDERQGRQTLTRHDGSFTVPATPPGRYRLLVLAGEARHVQEVKVPLERALVIDLESGPAEGEKEDGGEAEPEPR